MEAVQEAYAKQELVARLVSGDEGDEDGGAVDGGAQLGDVLGDIAGVCDRAREKLLHGGQRILPEVHDLEVRDVG